MACYNPETEEFQSVCRVMSGFSDAFYIEVIKSSTTLSLFTNPSSIMKYINLTLWLSAHVPVYGSVL